MLAQSYQNWELIFWDNQSKDKSAEIFKSFDDDRLKYYLTDTDLGGGRARAFQFSKGKFIAILIPMMFGFLKLEKQIPLFDDPEVGIVISDTLFLMKERKKLYGDQSPPTGQVFERLPTNYFVSLETLVIRKSSVLTL